MAFHFPLMPRIFMALELEQARPILEAMERTPPIPDGTGWCTFLRNHDELTLEMVTEDERQWMWSVYAPEPRMRLNLGIRRRLAPLLGNDPRRIMLANRILFSLPGSPIIYYGDEIGMGDTIDLPDRHGVRTPMQWSGALNAGFSEAHPADLYLPVIDGDTYGTTRVSVANQKADPASLFNHMKRLIKLVKEYRPYLTGGVAFLDDFDPSVLAFRRSSDAGELVAFHNLSGEPLSFDLPAALADGLNPIEADQSGGSLTDARATLDPYGSLFLLRPA
jgi:maltose alpha-D-glucosyltransferase/alpha-amylase